MKIAVTGGTGFVGSYVVEQLLHKKAQVIVTGTNKSTAQTKPWFHSVEFLQVDVNAQIADNVIKAIASADAIIHLAWPHLDNFKNPAHYENDLMPQYLFIKKLVEQGAKNITVTGTCLEYGLQTGALSPGMNTVPVTAYGLAKETLHKFLLQLQKMHAYNLKWVRIFYTYGKGQSKNSLIPQLEAALERGDTVFNMSGGEQLRDYLPVEKVAEKIINISLDPLLNGTFNCSSGKPVKVKDFVRDYLNSINKNIELNLGHYTYPDYEPMAFWGTDEI
ncbi:N/A [soil metagenome]